MATQHHQHQHLPDSQMQTLLLKARKSSSCEDGEIFASYDLGIPQPREIKVLPSTPRSSSHRRTTTNMIPSSGSSPRRVSILDSETSNRRLSEAGVNRRPSAAYILTEDTDSFIVGDRVYVDGIKPGRIQFIGETKFGPGDDWAGVFLDEPLGKNDGSVNKTRYFTCEPNHGIFSKLHRLTYEPIQNAEEALKQMRKYGYEVLNSTNSGSGGVSDTKKISKKENSGIPTNRRDSHNHVNNNNNNNYPEDERSRTFRFSPDSQSSGSSGDSGKNITGCYKKNHKTSLEVGAHYPERERYGSGGGMSPTARRLPTGRTPPSISPRNSRSDFGLSSAVESYVKIDKDPELTKLTSEARRLSMGGSARRTDLLSSSEVTDRNGRSSVSPRQDSSGYPRSPRMKKSIDFGGGSNCSRVSAHKSNCPIFSRKTSEGLGLGSAGNRSRSGSESDGGGGGGSRKTSSEMDPEEAQRRRLSEAGMRKNSSVNSGNSTDSILTENISNLMVGMTVWVDGTKRGRIAFIGQVHFTKGEVAGVHLDDAVGKNNGTVGGVMYFQCEPKRGIFSRLHRLTREPIIFE